MAMPTKKSEGSEQRKLFPDGWYDMLLIEAREGESKPKPEKNVPALPMGIFVFEISHGEETKKLTLYVVYQTMNEDGVLVQNWRLDNVIEALVLDTDPGELDVTALVGRRCRGEVLYEENEWKGRKTKRERIEKLERHEKGPEFQTAEETQAARAPAAAAVADEDLPF